MYRPREGHHLAAIPELIASARAGASARSLARKFGISETATLRMIVNAGLAPRPRNGMPLTAEEIEEIRRRARTGETQVQIASDLGRSKAAISELIRGVTHTGRARPRRGPKVDRRKLAARYKKGVPQDQLAVDFKTSTTNVARILKAMGVRLRTAKEAAQLAAKQKARAK